MYVQAGKVSSRECIVKRWCKLKKEYKEEQGELKKVDRQDREAPTRIKCPSRESLWLTMRKISTRQYDKYWK